ncbi:M23 family metallopeptidase [Streptomyces griseoincarnatus]|uniref:M23 family metallopeptidase n=1 Tax=Streptomyces griseoincarnatus TaxID=29305 RepID=A0ABT0VV26_STRGI|nr:M23 family metallopeptidase [Streptomyces griseoincarnatus]MCM2515205.1 M23 family metallopeptidase [Streptomyces griseoincarnatus]
MSARKLAKTAHRALLIAFFALVTAHVALDLGHPVWWDFLPLLLAYAVLVVANRWGGAPDSPRAARPSVEVEPPVAGRWIALNSPADHTPSHHTHAYGQTFAIDVVAEPEPGSRPPFRALWPVARRNADFPAHGAPLHAVADATVVRATDTARDHLSRGSLPALAYLMLLEANVRDLLGAGRILGNHVVLDLGGGAYALYAHLRRDSLTVREGDRVHAGQVLAQVGNSGNSTEPHLHFQLMDGPDPDTARGIPFIWRGIGVPRNNEVFEVPSRPVGARA